MPQRFDGPQGQTRGGLEHGREIINVFVDILANLLGLHECATFFSSLSLSFDQVDNNSNIKAALTMIVNILTNVFVVYNCCQVICTVLFIKNLDSSVFTSSNYLVKVFDRFLYKENVFDRLGELSSVSPRCQTLH